MPNLFEPDWDAERDEAPFRWRRAFVGRQAGRQQLRRVAVRRPARRRHVPAPPHLANEELLLVLAGRPTLVTPGGERELPAGEVVAFPAGRDGAHRLENRTDEEVRSCSSPRCAPPRST